MSATISVEGFVRSVSESGLLAGAELRATLESLGGEASVSNASELARTLVDAGRLTPFQADTILKGRVPELCIGNYVILNRLGAGGMGTVYKARHRTMHRVVALKILSRETGGQGSLAQRFQREVDTIAQLSHPNIVMAFDAGEDENGLYLVMEFVDGRDLAAEVAQLGRSLQQTPWTACSRRPGGLPTPTTTASSTAMSSLPTYCAIPRAWSRLLTLGSRGSPPPTRAV